MKSPQHGPERLEGTGRAQEHPPPPKPADRAICPHQARPQRSWSCKYPIRTFSKPSPWFPNSHLYADTHSAWALAPAPRERAGGQWPNSGSPSPSKRLVWCLPSSLLSGPQAQSIHVCIRVPEYAHICVNMILWRAESSRKFFCSEVISATPVQGSIWATQRPISQGLVLLVSKRHPRAPEVL